MNIFVIALKNLKRRKMKMAFAVIGLVIGVSTVISIYGIVNAMRLELGNKLDAYGPNIVIVPKSVGVDLNYDGAQVQEVTIDIKKLRDTDIPTIRAIADGDSINVISPKLVGAVTLGNRKALIVGVDTKSEFTMKPWFSLKSYDEQIASGTSTDLALLDLPVNGMILGYDLAKEYGAKPGDVIAINNKGFTVSGILNPMGSDEDGLIYANLLDAQILLNRPGEFSMIEVSGFCNFCPIEDMTSQLAVALPNSRVTALREAAMVREKTIDQFSSFGFILSLVTLFISSLVVMTTMLSSINERTSEIGIFRAIGFRRTYIAGIILIEVIVISLLAGLIGHFMGSVISQVAGPFLSQAKVATKAVVSMMQSDGLVNTETPDLWNLKLILPSILLSVIIASLSSLYPILKATKMDPVQALRFF